MSVAEACYVVFVSAEVLFLGGSWKVGRQLFLRGVRDGVVEKTYLSLKAQNCWLMTCQTISSDDMVRCMEVCYDLRFRSVFTKVLGCGWRLCWRDKGRSRTCHNCGPSEEIRKYFSSAMAATITARPIVRSAVQITPVSPVRHRRWLWPAVLRVIPSDAVNPVWTASDGL